MAVSTSSRLSRVDCNSANIEGSNIPFKTSGNTLVLKLTRLCPCRTKWAVSVVLFFLKLRRLASIKPYLSEKTGARLVAASITSRLDYRNSVLAGLPAEQICRLQRVQNSAARLDLKDKQTNKQTKTYNTTAANTRSLLLRTVTSMIDFPVTFQLLFIRIRPHSSSDSRAKNFWKSLDVISVGDRSFSLTATTVWNSLPASLRNLPTLCDFKAQLKTFLFQQAFPQI